LKCDELGPPCAACIARQITGSCTYQTSKSPLASQEAKTDPKVTEPSLGDMHLDDKDDGNHQSESTRLLELELMHRWSTSTYKSLCSADVDIHWIQVDVPRAAFKHTFLLNAILSMSALEIAICEEGIEKPKFDRLVQAALDYYDLASQSLRTQLDSNVEPEVNHSLYICCIILAAINMALPQCLRFEDDEQKPSMIDRMIVLFELYLGTSSVAAIGLSWMSEGPASESMRVAVAVVLEEGPDPLDDSTKMALAKLASIVDGNASSLSSDAGVRPETSLQGQSQVSYRIAMHLLRKCFVEDAKDTIKGFCVSFPMFAGREFAIAFKNREPIALLITMYWGVLLDRLGKLAWWTKSVGQGLVMEISEELQQSQLQHTSTLGWRETIAWSREQVGLT
jgi:hypothetical protein